MQQPMRVTRFILSSWLLHLCLLPLLVHSQCPAATEEGEQAGWWTEFGGSCYKWFNVSLPWFPAEVACRTRGGHLVSIRSDQENRLVGRLAGCRDAWVGQFLADFRRSSDPAGYQWTDERAAIEPAAADAGAAGYSKHNFSRMADPHMGAIYTSELTWYNSHYHETHPYVCEVPSKSEASADSTGERCPAPFAQYRDSCYWLSDFEASFVEASLHCERELHGHLASVHSRDELTFVGTLELNSDTCEMGTVWLGLIKLNPCRPLKSNPTDLCYQWTDLSGEHSGDFPEWSSGHPLRDDWTVNCASLSGEKLQSEKCHARRRFLCKRSRNRQQLQGAAAK